MSDTYCMLSIVRRQLRKTRQAVFVDMPILLHRIVAYSERLSSRCSLIRQPIHALLAI